MSKPERFCPECGSSQEPFVKSFCRNCFQKKHELFSAPNELKIDFCRNCGMARLHGKWVEQDLAFLEKAVEGFVKPSSFFEKSAVTVEIEQLDSEESIAHVTVHGLVDGQMLEAEKDILLKPNYVSCPRCSKIAGKYHEAIVQLRGKIPENAVHEFRSLLEQILRKDSLAVIVSLEKKKEGIDLLIGSRKAAKRAVDSLASKHKAEYD